MSQGVEAAEKPVEFTVQITDLQSFDTFAGSILFGFL